MREGKAEVCINNAWGSVCSTRFGVDDAAVLCVSGEFEREGEFLQLAKCPSELPVDMNY